MDDNASRTLALSQLLPPSDPEAENAVLSSMLYDREAVALAYETLKAGDFYRPDNQHVFEAMIDLFARGVPVDVITLGEKLTELGILEAVGGRDKIASLAAGYYTSANVREHTRIISEKSVLRKLIKSSQTISGLCFEQREEAGYILDQAEKLIFDIAQGRNTTDFAPIAEVLLQSIDTIEAAAKSKGHITGIETGFTDFDNKTAGLQPSDLILMGARPSMGKSAFMLNVAANVAIKKQIPVAFFALEMSKEQCVNRILCADAMVDALKLRNGDLNDKDWENIAARIGPISQGRLYFDDTPGISVSEVRAKCRRLKIEKGLGLVIIDYLQLMTGSSHRTENRQMEISEISRSLKGLAKELACPVFTAAQLSRAVEARADHRPMLSDLRESGAIEQDADVVTFLYRDYYYSQEEDKKNQAELIIAKQRNGPTGTVELTWQDKYTKFTGASR